MGYVFRVRLASFFAGAAVASSAGLYFLYQDYKVAHHSISDQMKLLHDSLDRRVSALESLKETEAPQQQVEATE
ncbi:hypothetical protein SOVF_138900 [Spinacia oleracea]|uniref:Uncharacterized protein n=1 Tax=Spinacia oleracea TaxID=3562 RepID=A0A9R0IXQ2_SPIOL|nr:uncharacterized protein LOC110796543 [Spinacia oleracea]KNA11030.1 hypothetical protein SOVF_138900 [Spinacia oleracea]